MKKTNPKDPKEIYKKFKRLSLNDESRLILDLLINSWNETRIQKKFGPGLYRYRRAVERFVGIDLKIGTSPYGECNEGKSCKRAMMFWKAAKKTRRPATFSGKHVPKNWDRQWFQFLEVWPKHHRFEMKRWLQNKHRPDGI